MRNGWPILSMRCGMPLNAVRETAANSASPKNTSLDSASFRPLARAGFGSTTLLATRCSSCLRPGSATWPSERPTGREENHEQHHGGWEYGGQAVSVSRPRAKRLSVFDLCALDLSRARHARSVHAYAAHQLLEEAGGDRAEAARRAGVGRSTMYRWIDAGLLYQPLDTMPFN
jgi:Bacterial regulatory protein, Fis family